MSENKTVRGEATNTFAHGAHNYHKGSVREFSETDFDDLEKVGLLKKTTKAITNLDSTTVEKGEEADGALPGDEADTPPLSGLPGEKSKGNAPQNKGR